jgi:nucleotide-binding universal stress UspA family protein
MAVVRRLLVAYDGSDQSNAALDVALELGRALSASTIVCYAVDVATELGHIAAGFHDAPALAEAMREEGQSILALAVSRAAASGWKIETALVDAPAASGINAFARRTRANAIVIGSHGRTGLRRVVLGSVAESVMRRADVPVLVVRTPSRPPKTRTTASPSGKLILVAYDSSDQSDSALDVAIGLAAPELASIVACYAMDVAAEIGRIAAGFNYAPVSAKKVLREDARAILARASSRAAAFGWKIETKLIDAPIVSGIIAFAARSRAGMIVTGSHGRSGLPRFILGSVAEGIMRHAEVPVLVVRTPSRRPAKRGALGAIDDGAPSKRRSSPRTSKITNGSGRR